LLLRDIGTKHRELQVLKAQQNSSSRDVAAKEEELAGLYKLVGDLLRCTMLASNYELAEDHFKKALKMYRRLSDLSHGSVSSNEGKHVDNIHETLSHLGHLYCQWHKECQAIDMYQDALDTMRSNLSAHGSTPWHQDKLASILAAQGNVHNEQYAREGSMSDKAKCLAAQALGEEALAIHRALNTQADELALDLTELPDRTLNQAYRQVRTAEVLLDVASTYTHLELFDKARSAMQEALDLCSRCYGNESERVAICHSQVASICSYEARAIRLKMVQSSSCYSLGSRVWVDGLQNYPQHNGLEGVVFKQENDSRVCVRLDQNNHELRLKLQNARPLVATADERKVLYTQLQDLADEGIASNTEYLRIQVKTHGVKHVNTARAHYSLGLALARTHRNAEVCEAIQMLTRAGKILRRVAAEDDPLILTYAQALERAQTALVVFEEPGVLSALPCWWPPTSRKQDEAAMARLFTALWARHGSSSSASISSEMMQQGLRMQGLFNFTASSCDSVSGCGAICCHASATV